MEKNGKKGNKWKTWKTWKKMETWKISGKSFITKRWKLGSIFWGVAVAFLCNFDMTLHFGVFGIIRTY